MSRFDKQGPKQGDKTPPPPTLASAVIVVVSVVLISAWAAPKVGGFFSAGPATAQTAGK